MPKLEFVGQTARNPDFKAANPCRLINGYREPMLPGSRGSALLRAVPGMATFVDTSALFMRAMMPWQGDILAVVGTNLYAIAEDGTITLVGDVGADSALTDISQSTGYAVVVAGGQYWHWNGTTLTSITPGNVTVPSSVAYLGGYIVVSETNARVFAWSALADPTTWSGLDFASAEITDDPIIRLIVFKDALYIFKATGFERWAVTGLAGPDAFQRIGGAQEEPGLAGYGLITTFPNGFAFVGTDGRVYVSGVGPISTPALEVELEQSQPERMFFYEQRGHGFICLIFRNAPAWCYDVATGEWHERSQSDGPWQARASVKLNSAWYIGTDNGQIAKLTSDCRDFGDPMVRRYVSRALEPGNRFNVAKIEAFPRISGDIQGDGDLSEAKITLKTSRDGIEFGAGKDRGVGSVGKYETRLTWRALGQFRKATVEISQSSAVDVPMLAEIDVEVA
jgi:hypothetical protein